jgi:hypothetical protein
LWSKSEITFTPWLTKCKDSLIFTSSKVCTLAFN